MPEKFIGRPERTAGHRRPKRLVAVYRERDRVEVGADFPRLGLSVTVTQPADSARRSKRKAVERFVRSG